MLHGDSSPTAAWPSADKPRRPNTGSLAPVAAAQEFLALDEPQFPCPPAPQARHRIDGLEVDVGLVDGHLGRDPTRTQLDRPGWSGAVCRRCRSRRCNWPASGRQQRRRHGRGCRKRPRPAGRWSTTCWSQCRWCFASPEPLPLQFLFGFCRVRQHSAVFHDDRSGNLALEVGKTRLSPSTTGVPCIAPRADTGYLRF